MLRLVIGSDNGLSPLNHQAIIVKWALIKKWKSDENACVAYH